MWDLIASLFLSLFLICNGTILIGVMVARVTETLRASRPPAKSSGAEIHQPG